MAMLTLDLPSELIARLETEARHKQISTATLIQETLEQTFPEQPGTDSGPVSVYDLTQEFCGCMNSGLGDLASNPRHLEGLGA
jgi:hypothetical protein